MYGPWRDGCELARPDVRCSRGSINARGQSVGLRGGVRCHDGGKRRSGDGVHSRTVKLHKLGRRISARSYEARGARTVFAGTDADGTAQGKWRGGSTRRLTIGTAMGLPKVEHPRGRARVDLSAVFFQHSLMENSMLSALKARKDSIAGDRPGALVVPCSGDGEADVTCGKTLVEGACGNRSRHLKC